MMTEKESFIQLEKDDVIRIGIKDSKGNDTGKFLTFDMEDIELPLRLSNCEELHKKNIMNLRDKFVIIDKKEDKKGKKLLSWKEEEKVKAIQEFYKNEMVALDMFVGDGNTQMLLDLMGRNPYYSMFDDITKMLEPIMPMLKVNVESIKKKIVDKYSNNNSEVMK